MTPADGIPERDPTDLQRTVARLQSEVHQLTAALENAETGIFELQRDGRICLANAALSRQIGISRTELRNRTVSHVLGVTAENREIIQQLVERGKSGHVASGRLRFPRPFGPDRLFQITVRPVFDDAGDVYRLVASSQEMTHILDLEERLAASRKLQAAGQLAGALAHDFNNILQIIRGCCDLTLLHLADDHPAREYAEEIRQAQSRAAGLIQQLLAYGGHTDNEPDQIDLNAAVTNHLQMLRHIGGSRLSIQFRPVGRVPPITADPHRLERLLMALVLYASERIGGSGKLVFLSGTPADARHEPILADLVLRGEAPGLGSRPPFAPEESGSGPLDNEDLRALAEEIPCDLSQMSPGRGRIELRVDFQTPQSSGPDS